MKKTPENISELGKKIADFNNKDSTADKGGQVRNFHLFAEALALGTEFVAAVLVGVGLGFVLDMVFASKVVFTIIFSLFGCVAGVLNMYRRMEKIEKNID